MWTYAIKRLISFIPVYIAVMAFITYISWEQMDVVDSWVSKNASAKQRQELRKRFGLTGNLWIRNLKKVGNTLTFDYGESLGLKQPVVRVIKERLPVSLMLTLPALFFSTFLGVLIGLISAFYRGRPIDRALIVSATMGMSVSFLVYIIVLQYLLAFRLKLFHIYGFGDTMWESVPYLILPVFIQVLVSLGYNSRFYRAVMVEESTKDYITTAYAKGVSTPRVIFIHVLKNAMIPIITRFFVALPFTVMGSFLLEIFFGIPGLGSVLIESLTGKTDPPLIIGVTAVLCSVYLIMNIVADLMYAVVDPRVRLD